jgi:hypothetical protein
MILYDFSKFQTILRKLEETFIHRPPISFPTLTDESLIHTKHLRKKPITTGVPSSGRGGGNRRILARPATELAREVGKNEGLTTSP